MDKVLQSHKEFKSRDGSGYSAFVKLLDRSPKDQVLFIIYFDLLIIIFDIYSSSFILLFFYSFILYSLFFKIIFFFLFLG